MSYIGFDKIQFFHVEPSAPSKVLPIIIAKAKTKLYMGKGIEFFCDDEEVMKKWKEFSELNLIYDFINNQQKTKSLSGVSIISINKLEDGSVVLNNIAPYVGPTQITYCFSTPEFVCIVEQVALSSHPVYMRSVYTKEFVMRRFWVSNSGKDIYKYTEFKPFDKSFEVDKLLGINLGEYDKERDCWILKHNFGFIPVEIMTNLPFRPYFPIFNVSIFAVPPSNDSMYGISYNEVADCANVQFLLKQLDEIYKNQNVCISLSKPGVVVVANTEAQAREIAKKNFLSKDYTHSVLFSSGANKVNIQVVNPTTNLEQLYKATDETLEKIYKFIGLAYKQVNSTQKTSMESYTNYQGDIEMVNFMKNYDTEQWKKVFIKVFKMMGIDLTKKKWYFKTNENMVANIKEMLDNDIKLYQIKAMTQEQILQDVKSLNPQEAKTIVEENKKWFKKNKDLLESPMNSAVSGVKSMSLANKKPKTNE